MKNEFYQEYRDLFGYYKIITKINPFYKLCFDKKAKDFVVINTDRNEEVCIRFDEFNFNLEKSLQESHVKNAEKIFEMVDEHNREVEQKAKKDSSYMLKTRLNELFSYSKRTNHISDSDIKKIIEVKNA